MNRATLLFLLMLPLGLSGCGQEPADEALSRMHDALVKKSAVTMIVPKPGPSRTTTDMHVIAKSGKEGNFQGTADVTLKGSMSSDVGNARNPLTEGTVNISAKIDSPAGTFTGNVPKNPATAPDEKVTADLTLSAKTVDRTILLNIASILVTAPVLPQPFALTEEFGTRWYGITFEEVDKYFAERMKQTGEKAPPSVEQLLTQKFENHVDPVAAAKLLSGIHVWKGIEMLPEKDGLLQISVESDKEKIRSSVHMITAYLKKTSGGAWETQVAGNPEMQSRIQMLEDEDGEFMKTMGSVKGVLSADKDSYAFMGFDGDVMDASGALQGHVTISLTKGGDASLMIKNEETGDRVVFEKHGETVSGAFNDKPILKGTVSKSRVDLTTMDPERGKTTLTVSFAIKTFSPTAMEITDGDITVPSKATAIHLKELSVETTPDHTVARLEATGESEAMTLFSIVLRTERESIPPLKLEKPSYRPIKGLYQDLLQIMVGAATPPEDEEMAP